MPMLTNVEISGSALLRHAPAQVPDVFEGAPLVAALALRAEGGEIVVRGQLARDSWGQTIKVPARNAGEGNQAIAALYGRERVADVEANAMFETSNGEIEDLGLLFQIATRMTSWIAVDDSRRVTEAPTTSEVIPQELPYGTSAGAFGLRAPAPAQAMMAGVGSVMFDAESAPSEIDELTEAEVAAEIDAGAHEFKTKAGTFRATTTRAGVVRSKAPRPTESQPMAGPPPTWEKRDEGVTGKYKAVEAVEDKKLQQAPEKESSLLLGRVSPAPQSTPQGPSYPAQQADQPAPGFRPAPIEEPKPITDVVLDVKPKLGPHPFVLRVYLVLALIIAALIWWLLR
jgi:Ca-activated chloride channel family protein